MSGIALALADRLWTKSAHMRDVSRLFGKTWRRTVRRRGGFFVASVELSQGDVERRWMEDFFAHGMLREIREVGSGQETWRGMVVAMEYTRGGETFAHDFKPVANAIKVLYTRIGDNALTNGSGESGAWSPYPSANANLHITQDSSWSSHGTYSIKIVVDDSTVRGAYAQSSGYVIPIVAGKQYLIRATLKVTSGSWRLSANKSSDDTSLAHYSTAGATGDHVVSISIDESNTFAGNIDLRVTSEGTAGTVNVDACVFQLGPESSDTGWYLDNRSIAVFGRKEDVILESGMSVANAQARAQSERLKRAWPNPTPPSTGGAHEMKTNEDKLQITFAGDWYRLNWLHTTLHGTRTMSDWVRALLGQQTQVTPGRIQANSTDYYVEDQAPLLLGDILKGIAGDGEVGGARWGIGVYAQRKLTYERIDSALRYKFQNGQIYDIHGGWVAPWLARPGWMLYQDLPAGGYALTAHAEHDPRWVFVEEWEMMPPDAAHGGKPWLQFNQDESGGM
jgi:hypothetical protein